MKISEAVDAVNSSSGKAMLDVAFDRLRNNFYGYLLTSLLFFNLENIILIIKSKDPIELTLIYIGLQKEFSWHFFGCLYFMVWLLQSSCQLSLQYMP